MGDIERILSRIALKSARPRDLSHLAQALPLLNPLNQILVANQSSVLQKLRLHLTPLPELADLLTQALVENPPMIIRDGGVIATGFDEELDELRALNEHATDKLTAFELQEKERTGLSSLKIWF